MDEVKRQECELLEAHALPLRNYLMKYVMPSLTEAMLECCKISPEDPVDFLVRPQFRFSVDFKEDVTLLNMSKAVILCFVFAG